jgi:hypothetical protein
MTATMALAAAARRVPMPRPRAAGTFAGDDQSQFGILRLRRLEKMQKRCVRLSLRHAVKIDPNIDRRLAARHALPQASIKLCQSRRLFCLHAFLARVVRRR